MLVLSLISCVALEQLALNIIQDFVPSDHQHILTLMTTINATSDKEGNECSLKL